MRQVIFKDLGLLDYQEAWDYQQEIFDHTVDLKLRIRKGEIEEQITENHLIFCEHPHVYTLGKSGSEDNLLIDTKGLQEKQASYYHINRGGDITYHGPGQLVVYPIFDLDHFFTDIHKYLRYLEEAVILTIAEYGVQGGRIDSLTGVWLDADDPQKCRKICALGVKCSRWVTMHGIGFNVNTDLSYFSNIVPCGIDDKAVTSLSKEVGRPIDMDELKAKLRLNLANVFDFDYVN